jgi:hypothetical protein
MTWISDMLEDGKATREKIDITISAVQGRNAEYIDYACGDPEFAIYLLVVDRVLMKKVGVKHRDLRDWPWRDAFDTGMRPLDAAGEAVAADSSLWGAMSW